MLHKIKPTIVFGHFLDTEYVKFINDEIKNWEGKSAWFSFVQF
jgi:hypothetical protein